MYIYIAYIYIYIYIYIVYVYMNTVFNHEHLDRELEAATRRFCSERVRVDLDANEVKYCSKVQ